MKWKFLPLMIFYVLLLIGLIWALTNEDIGAYEAPSAQPAAEVAKCPEGPADSFGEQPAAEPPEEPEDFENEKIEAALLARAHRIEGCKITYYCCEKYPHICGTGDGITAMGTEVTPGVSCAVPKPIPLGSTIIIDWGDGSDLEYRRGDDRGGGVIGDHIDLAVPTHHEALDLGVARATVYWVEEE